MKPISLVMAAALFCTECVFSQSIPTKIPRRSSTQLADGFGVNLDLPRAPRMPWTRTWTPLFDAGVKWVRVGQYENSSEQVSWDWAEQTPGHYAVPVSAEESVRSLVENSVDIENQGNLAQYSISTSVTGRFGCRNIGEAGNRSSRSTNQPKVLTASASTTSKYRNLQKNPQSSLGP